MSVERYCCIRDSEMDADVEVRPGVRKYRDDMPRWVKASDYAKLERDCRWAMKLVSEMYHGEHPAIEAEAWLATHPEAVSGSYSLSRY